VNLERLGNITAELSSNLVKSIVLPGGLLARLTRSTPAAPRSESRSEAETVRQPLPAGPVVLLGGCPVPDHVVVQLIHLCGGRAARIAVIPVGTDDPQATGQTAARFFTRFGMKQVEVIELSAREQADNPAIADRIGRFDTVVLHGENVAAAVALLSGTLVAGALHQFSALGRPVIGCAAGSAVMAAHCLTEDGSVVDGLGLVPRTVIEPGFSDHARFSRLLNAVGANFAAQTLGIGLDEQTALFVRDGEALVVGDGGATFVDTRDVSQYEETGGEAGKSCICDVKVHRLVAGWTLSLRSRKPVAPLREIPTAVGG
jgi:cyanophycinase